MEILDIKAQTKVMIDSLKAVCTTYVLGSARSEYKIISEIYLYKYLNDKFIFEMRKANSTWHGMTDAEVETQLNSLSDDDYEMALFDIGGSTAKLMRNQFISYLFNRQNEEDFHKLFDQTLLDIANQNMDIFSVQAGGSSKIRLFDALSPYVIEAEKRDAFCRAMINKLADAIIDYDAAALRCAIEAGCDGVSFGDDYGTQYTMLMSPEMWRSFFKPRLKRLFAPAVEAGLDIHFHSCGMVRPILEDLADIGVTSVWPQLPAYDMQDLASLCRSLGLAVAIHTDRAITMTHGTPQQVRDLVLREYDTFKMQDGGSWFYIEADNGFPYENLEALVNTVRELRGE